MKMEEKIEKKLKKYLPGTSGTWVSGFKIGFQEGYLLALEELTEMLKEIREEITENP